MTLTPRQYKDVSGNPCSLGWLIKNEPAWAENQIRHRDRLESELEQLADKHRKLQKELRQWREDCCCAMKKERDALKTEVQDIKAAIAAAQSPHADEVHCSCCGLLRAELKREQSAHNKTARCLWEAIDRRHAT